MDISKLDKNMAIKDPEKDLYWYDAANLTIEGKGWTDTEAVYQRLPAKAKDLVRQPVWRLSTCSAGISIRFTTDTHTFSVRWDGLHAMDHMTAVGCSGLDLYVKHDRKWKYLSVGRPTQEMNEVELFTNLAREPREFILNLPLYNPIQKIELGIPDSSDLKPTPPRTQKPIVFYGTSITQGGCASRPGMNYSAILGRWLDWPVINLGFSGNGVMDPEIIDLLCELDPSVYVLDCLPNMGTVDMINERTESTIRKLRDTHPQTPIVIIDNILYCDAYLKESVMTRYTSCNKAQHDIYDRLAQEGMTDLHYIKDNGLIGTDGEATVDGTHFTDLGYMRFAENLIGSLREILKK